MQQSYGKISREFLFYLQKLIGALDLKFCITQNNSCQLFYALSINFVFLLAHFRSGPIVATKKTWKKSIPPSASTIEMIVTGAVTKPSFLGVSQKFDSSPFDRLVASLKDS